MYTNGCEPQGTTWYTDGSRKGNSVGIGGATVDCRAGFGLHCGPLHVIGRVRGPQTPYRVELMGMYVASCQAQAGDEVVLDNQAAADCATTAPYHEVCDVDIRQPLAQSLHDKSLMPKWVPGHREERQARTIQEARDIRGNNLSDSLASMGSELPLTPYTPDAPHGIGVGGTEAPTPAKKWITAMRPHATPEGVHWATWLPLKSERRRLWLQWVWGNVWWKGCMPPWKKSTQPCALCGSTHQGAAQARLVQCGTWRTLFLDEWVKT